MKNPFSKTKENIGVASLDYKNTRHFLHEKGNVKFSDTLYNIDTMGIADQKVAKNIEPLLYDYSLYLQCYKQIPKVFRAINTRANFAVQSGFKLLGEKEDIKKLEDWMRNVHFDNHLIQIVKEMLLFGNVFISPVGKNKDTELKFLPVTTMRVLRSELGEHLGFVQIYNSKVNERWEPDELIHYRWNTIGTDVYGIPELRSVLNVLEKKLDNEATISKAIKSQFVPKIIFKCGVPEKPFSDAQIGAFKNVLENRDVSSDVIVSGDINTDVVQHNRGSGESIISLIQHIEAQVDTGLNFPEILIAGRADAQGSIIQMDSLERDVKTIQDVLGMGMEKNIFTRILGKEDVPMVVWNPMNIETELRLSRTLRQLVGDGSAPPIITPDEARKSVGYEDLTDEQKKTMADLKQDMNPIQPMGGFNGPEKPTGDEPNPTGGKKVPVPKVQKVDKTKPSS